VNDGTDSRELQRCEKFKDPGVITDSKLSFDEHNQEKVNKAYGMLGIIKSNFRHIDRVAFIMLYRSLVRSHLEYAHSVRSQHKQYLTEEIEKVQK